MRSLCEFLKQIDTQGTDKFVESLDLDEFDSLIELLMLLREKALRRKQKISQLKDGVNGED